MKELRTRQVIRGNNNPTGDYAEWLVAKVLGLTLETQAARGFDAKDSEGIRFQIKGRRVTALNGSVQMGVIRDIDKFHFDILIAVLFEENWDIRYVARMPHSAVESLANYSDHQRGHILHLRPNCFDHPTVENISHMFKYVTDGKTDDA
jgi:hypothetical protein